MYTLFSGRSVSVFSSRYLFTIPAVTVSVSTVDIIVVQSVQWRSRAWLYLQLQCSSSTRVSSAASVFTVSNKVLSDLVLLNAMSVCGNIS